MTRIDDGGVRQIYTRLDGATAARLDAAARNGESRSSTLRRVIAAGLDAVEGGPAAPSVEDAPTVTAAELAGLLGVSLSTVKRRMDAGEIPAPASGRRQGRAAKWSDSQARAICRRYGVNVR